MGSSSSDSGPPPEAVAAREHPLEGFTPMATPQAIPQSPVGYPNFINGLGIQSGLTPGMEQAIMGNDAGQPPPGMPTPGTPSPAAAEPAPPPPITMADIEALNRLGNPSSRGNFSRMGMGLVGQSGPEARTQLADIINRAGRSGEARWGRNS